MGIWGHFSPKSPGGMRTRFQKWVNGEVSGIGTCKFEFSTIKTHITTYKMAFPTNIRKSPQKGCFLALKVPRGREPEFWQGQEQQFYVHINYLQIFGKFQKNLMEG